MIHYGLDRWERLESDIDAAVDRAIDEGNEFPLRFEVFRPMEIPGAVRIADRALEETLEWLDETYSDPDGNPTEPNDAMRAAALAFAEAVRANYVSWSCEPTGETVTISKGDSQC